MSSLNIETVSEEQLVIKVQQGDRKSWNEIIRLYYTPLYHFILSMVKIEDVAEELVQDIFVNFWQKKEKITITTSLKAYLYRASRNHTLNYLKRKKFELEYQKNLAQNYIFHTNNTEESVQYSELEKSLNEAIENLPELCREVFKLSRFEEMTYKEIAEAMDIPVRSVHYQIGLALKELREKLKGHHIQEFLPYSLFPFSISLSLVKPLQELLGQLF